MAKNQLNTDLVSRIGTTTNSQEPLRFKNNEVQKVLYSIDTHSIGDAQEGNRNEVDNPFFESNPAAYIMIAQVPSRNSNPNNYDLLITPENTDSFGYLRSEFSNKILPDNSVDKALSTYKR